jgi:hypothetical protein
VSANNTLPCQDGFSCTTNDTCSGGACTGGTPNNVSCQENPDNVCTTNTCAPTAPGHNPTTGCVSANNTLPCQDGDACTTDDTCSGGACVGGPPTNCDDDNVCTDDGCNPAAGCVHTNNNNACNDGDACTSGETCQGGVCTGTATSCKVTGGGQLVNLGDKVSFGLNAQRGQSGFKGQVEYNNHTDSTAYHSLSIGSVMVEPIPAGSCSADPGNLSLSGQKATIEGTIRRKGTQGELGFTLILEDCGEPGRNDYFNMVITDGENRFGRLDKGNIQVH